MDSEISPEIAPDMIRGRYPHVYRRLVHWGECDPQGVIYTPRASEYAIDVIENWLIEAAGINWLQIRDQGLGCPTVSTQTIFSHVLRVGAVVDLAIRVKKVGSSSVTFEVQCINEQGVLCFTVEHISCFVTDQPFASVPIPDEIRKSLEAYLAACKE